MSGLFGIVSSKDCRQSLFYGTDYHSHLGTKKAGLAVFNHQLTRCIHDISTSQFKSKFIEELPKLKGKKGIGVISDFDSQPIIISCSFGNFAIATSGLLRNKNELAKEIMSQGGSFSEMSSGMINATEVIGKLVAGKNNIVSGMEYVFSRITGSISLLVLSREGVYAGRDCSGKTTLVAGKKDETLAVTSETCAFPNLGFEPVMELQPGEIVLLSREGLKKENSSKNNNKVCSFLWIYTGYPASSYEGINVEKVRENCGANLARDDNIEADLVTGVPDSGTAHALGYSMSSGIPYRRPLVKYTDGYGRSYTPPSQEIRNKVAKLKLIPIKSVIEDKRIIVCDDSIVRGTQLRNQAIEKLWRNGAREIHARIACPPLMFPCPYLLATRTKKELVARRVIRQITGEKQSDIEPFLNENSPQYRAMVKVIQKELGVTSLKYQTIDDMVKAIGLPGEKLCLYCWNGKE
ncbi:MAG: Amidophosphoribosyltransferase precursor [Actinobacteria bacterium ADurb.Bin346]|nr:MAG: Amidophosphoribosyltransferase precursor [Actinobacteria bacterium ADurb.Bin346]